jgi:hypothetical protein
MVPQCQFHWVYGDPEKTLGTSQVMGKTMKIALINEDLTINMVSFNGFNMFYLAKNNGLYNAIYIYMYVCIYVYMYIYICIYIYAYLWAPNEIIGLCRSFA